MKKKTFWTSENIVVIIGLSILIPLFLLGTFEAEKREQTEIYNIQNDIELSNLIEDGKYILDLGQFVDLKTLMVRYEKVCVKQEDHICIKDKIIQHHIGKSLTKAEMDETGYAIINEEVRADCLLIEMEEYENEWYYWFECDNHA